MPNKTKTSSRSIRRSEAERSFTQWARPERMKLLPGVALNVRPDTFAAVVKIARSRRERPSAVVRSLIEQATHTTH